MKREIRNFYELDAWKKGHLLVLDVYKVTREFPKEELYGIVSQLRRAASSITANIAEGFARYHFKDKGRFYHNARGSVAEVQNFLILARDLGYINFEKCKESGLLAAETGKLVNGLVRSLEKQGDNKK